MEPAMFSVAKMFDAESGDEEGDAFVEREHTFPGLVLLIREFAFHQLNANLLWPGASIFAEWIVLHEELVQGRRVLELGSGTGALAIFLRKRLELDITTSDYDDVEIENNIQNNCCLNNLATLPHIRHTWGEDFPCTHCDWDLIIASDILLCYKMGSQQIERQKLLATGPYIGEIHHVSGSEIQSNESLGSTSSGQKDHNPLNSTNQLQLNTMCSKSGMIPGPGLCRNLSDHPCVDGDHHSAHTQACAPSKKLTLAQACVLPRPCFLMSWRRRIPKEDEALFFDGCRSAGFVVTDFGSRVYCIH